MNDKRGMIREGMTVRASDGEKLGKVKELRGDDFIIEKGLFFKEDYLAHMGNVVDERDGELIYERGEGYVAERPIAGTPTSERTAAEAERTAAETERAGAAAGEEMRVPLAEEQLVVEKERRPTEGVRVHKEVKTEEQQVTVPVRREEVVVERTPVNEARPASGEAFGEKDVQMRGSEEEVHVSKRPVVREEVRLRKQPIEEQRAASAEVRREEAEVEDLQAPEKRGDIEVEEGEARRAPSREEDIEKY